VYLVTGGQAYALRMRKDCDCAQRIDTLCRSIKDFARQPTKDKG
jgi:hypothetical protein